ncbi:MAG: 7-carboxy-7-deazaguanine synthase QueE [Bdellovibrionota bacterium]
MTPSYLVNEIYPCLQGEGPNLGKPSLLVRLQICNLRCTWCDTPYTHTMKSDPVDNNATDAQNFHRISLTELIAKIQTFEQKHLILTGGEPTLQNIGTLMRELVKIDSYSFEVESNGTRIPHNDVAGFLQPDYLLAQWNISPKFSNAGETIEANALKHWANLSKTHEKVYFKFVIRESFCVQDIHEVLSIVQQYNIQPHRVILMPEGISIESQINNKWLHDECLKYGYRYTPRLHVLLFGNLRGV